MNTKILAAFLAILTALACATGHAKEPNKETHYYTVEFTKPVKHTDPIIIVNVTFYEKPSDEYIQKVLAAEVRAFVEANDPTVMVMSFAYLHKPKTDPDMDDNIGDGDKFACYYPPDKKFLSTKELVALDKKK